MTQGEIFLKTQEKEARIKEKDLSVAQETAGRDARRPGKKARIGESGARRNIQTRKTKEARSS